MHVVSRYTAAEAAERSTPAAALSPLAWSSPPGLAVNSCPRLSVTGTLSLLTALIAAFGVGWGFTRGRILALSLTPGGDALGLSAVSGRLAAGAGGLVWRAGLSLRI